MSVRTKWVVYGAIPFTVTLIFQLMYFSGVLQLQRLICPKLPPLHPGAYREFGLLEISQNLLILGILFVVLAGARRSVVTMQRAVFLVIALFSTAIFLEEIDYGTHFYNYVKTDEVAGWFEPAITPNFQALVSETNFQTVPFNIHNRGDLTDIIKGVVTVLMLGLFVVAPFLVDRVRNPWIKYLIPDRFIVVTIAVMVISRLITDGLESMDKSLIAAGAAEGRVRELGSIANNLSEFRELITYYAFLVYLGVLVFCREAPVVASSQATIAPEP